MKNTLYLIKVVFDFLVSIENKAEYLKKILVVLLYSIVAEVIFRLPLIVMFDNLNGKSLLAICGLAAVYAFWCLIRKASPDDTRKIFKLPEFRSIESLGSYGPKAFCFGFATGIFLGCIAVGFQSLILPIMITSFFSLLGKIIVHINRLFLYSDDKYFVELRRDKAFALAKKKGVYLGIFKSPDNQGASTDRLVASPSKIPQCGCVCECVFLQREESPKEMIIPEGKVSKLIYPLSLRFCPDCSEKFKNFNERFAVALKLLKD